MKQSHNNRYGLIALALFIIGLMLVAFCSNAPHQYADFNCPVCGSDHVLVISDQSAQCPDCRTQIQF